MSVKEFFLKKKVAKSFVEEVEISYKFENELGSIMTMEFPNGGGLVTGSYKSGVSDPNSYPLTGFVSGNSSRNTDRRRCGSAFAACLFPHCRFC